MNLADHLLIECRKLKQPKQSVFEISSEPKRGAKSKLGQHSKKIMERLEEGFSILEICDEVGFSRTGVRDHITRHLPSKYKVIAKENSRKKTKEKKNAA